MRLIDADALIRSIESKVDMQDLYCPIHLIQFIHEEPTVEPKLKIEFEDNRPKGEWKQTKEAYFSDSTYKFCFDCSLCKCRFDYLFNFCPNCGASMRKGETE